MNTYRVTGIVQYCILGEWHERPVRTDIRAEDRTAAIAAALTLEQDAARRIDTYATARWHTPEWVGAQQIRG